MPKTGRPKKEINTTTFQNLCKIQCTLPEMAAVLNVSEDTVERWCKRTYKATFAEIHKRFGAGGKSSLRRLQFKAAERGNTTMLIWLGKQYLGQRDHVDLTLLDARERAENSIKEFMQRTGKTRAEAIEFLTPHIPQISELIH